MSTPSAKLTSIKPGDGTHEDVRLKQALKDASARRLETSHNRRLSAEAIADMQALGALRAGVPQRFGGDEKPFAAFNDVALELAGACGSTGWLTSIFGSHSWWLSKCNEGAQEEIWADGPDAVIAGTFPSKHVVANPVYGGYRVTGEWMFCSGVHNADWVTLTVPVQDSGDETRLYIGHFRGSEVDIDDTWDTVGMRGTGSNDVSLNDIFIPSHRMTLFTDLNSRCSPGQSKHNSAPYRLSTTSVFAYSIVMAVIGAARGALNEYVASMRERVLQWQPTRIAALTPVQLKVAESAAEIDCALALYRDDIKLIRSAGEEDRDLTAAEIARLKRNCPYMATLAKRATTRLTEVMGAHGANRENPVQILHADTQTGGSHLALSFEANAPEYAKHLFGL